MMRFQTKVALVVVVLILSAMPVLAAKPGDTVKLKLLHFNFADEHGQLAQFQMANGGSVSIKNAELGLTYRMTARSSGRDRVQVTLVEIDSVTKAAGPEQTFVLRRDGGLQGVVAAPFSLEFTGLTKKVGTLAPPSGRSGDRSGESLIGCCISCGGWIVCCEVELGPVPEQGDYICCIISSSCGNGCGVCEIAF